MKEYKILNVNNYTLCDTTHNLMSLITAKYKNISNRKTRKISIKTSTNFNLIMEHSTSLKIVKP